MLVACSAPAPTVPTGAPPIEDSSPASDQRQPPNPTVLRAQDRSPAIGLPDDAVVVEKLSWVKDGKENWVYGTDQELEKLVHLFEEQFQVVAIETKLSNRTEFEINGALPDTRAILVRLRPVPESMRTQIPSKHSISVTIQPKPVQPQEPSMRLPTHPELRKAYPPNTGIPLQK